MPTDQFQIEKIFAEAAEIADAAVRNTYLDQACGGDAALRERVVALLAAHDSANCFLQLSGESDHATVAFVRLSEGPGTRIGRYKLLEEIGEGGFGVVFMAEQEEPVRRRVALKVIKTGMDTRQVVARFEAERQALAMMDHANIARVFDAGATDTGRPYFVMELVKGIPITTYCDKHRLGIPQRLELFGQVCQAVQHAHQKGLIHRDIKPTNVLVCTQDDRPAVKVIDFGVAKAIQARLTEKTLFTEFNQLIGTPAYMSPEQAEGGLDIDTRSDVYSLGVLLYELLAGTPPFSPQELRSKAFAEMQRIIREVEPPSPSARLSTLTDTLPSVAAQRAIDPRKLVATVRGELDWIVMRALEKDRTRRYESASSLARDVERHLRDQPVQACPPSVAYRLKKFILRNRVSVVASLTVVLALFAGLALATTGLIQARHQARIAVAEAAKATAVANLLQEALQSANPDKARGADYTVRQLLDEISVEVKEQFKDQPEVEATIRATIGNAYRRLGVLDKAGPHLQAALDLRRRQFGSESPEVADSLADYAWYMGELGDGQRCEAAAREAVAIHRKLHLPDDHAVKVLEALAMSIWAQAEKYGELEQIANEIRAIARRQPEKYPEVANVLHWMAQISTDPVKGEQLAREAINLHRKLHGEYHPETAWGHHVLANKLNEQQKFDEAEAHYREALAIFRRSYDDAQVPVLQQLLSLVRLSKIKGDRAALDELRAKATEIASVDSADFQSWQYRGILLEELGQLKLAVAAYSRAIQLNNSNVDLRLFRGQSYQTLGELQNAEEDFSKAIELDPGRWTYWYARSQLYAQRHQLDKAKADLGMAVKRCPAIPAELNKLAWSLATMADARLRDPQSAVGLATKAVAVGPNDANSWKMLGVAQYQAGDWNAAAESLGKSIELRHGGDAFEWFFLAMAHQQIGHKDEARKWFDRAVKWTDKNAPADEELSRFRNEAAEFLGIDEPESPGESAASAPYPQQ